MYRHDIIKLDCQDDDAAYYVFYSRNLQNYHNIKDTQGLFVYLFIIGKLDKNNFIIKIFFYYF